MKRTILFLLLLGQVCHATLPHAFCGFQYVDTFTPLKLRRDSFLHLLGQVADVSESISDRARAATILGRTGQEETLIPLTRIAFSDSDPELRAAAIQAIGRIGFQSKDFTSLLEAVLLEKGVPAVRSAAMMVLTYRRPEIASSYLSLFPFRESEGTPEENRVAIKCLGHLNASQASPILQRTVNGNLWRARAAFDAMGKLGDPENVEILALKLRRSVEIENFERAAFAAIALGEMGDRNYADYIELVMESIKGDDEKTLRIKEQFLIALVYMRKIYHAGKYSGATYPEILAYHLTSETSPFLLYHITLALCRAKYAPALKNIDQRRVLRVLNDAFPNYVLDEYDLLRIRHEVEKLREFANSR